MLSLAKLAVEPNMHPLSPLVTPEARAKIYEHAWPAFASFTWAFVMYIFRWYPDTLVSSLRSSMVYMYVSIPCLLLSSHPLRTPIAYEIIYACPSRFLVILKLTISPLSQLRRLGPLGLVPKLVHTQQISLQRCLAAIRCYKIVAPRLDFHFYSYHYYVHFYSPTGFGC